MMTARKRKKETNTEIMESAYPMMDAIAKLTDAQGLKLARLIAERARDNQRQSPVRDNFER